MICCSCSVNIVKIFLPQTVFLFHIETPNACSLCSVWGEVIVIAALLCENGPPEKPLGISAKFSGPLTHVEDFPPDGFGCSFSLQNAKCVSLIVGLTVVAVCSAPHCSASCRTFLMFWAAPFIVVSPIMAVFGRHEILERCLRRRKPMCQTAPGSSRCSPQFALFLRLGCYVVATSVIRHLMRSRSLTNMSGSLRRT